jgi:hypothetical protein
VKANGSGGSVTSSALTLQTILVGVYDANSGLSGFIDPNSNKFQLYNGSKANFQIDGVNPVSGVKDNLGSNVLVSNSLAPVASATTMSVVIDASTAKIFKLSLATTMTANIVFTISTSSVPVAGTTVVIIFNSGPVAASNSKGISFTTGFADEGAITIAANAAAANFVFTFISDGTSLFEIARNIGVITSTVVGLQADGAA